MPHMPWALAAMNVACISFTHDIFWHQAKPFMIMRRQTLPEQSYLQHAKAQLEQHMLSVPKPS